MFYSQSCFHWCVCMLCIVKKRWFILGNTDTKCKISRVHYVWRALSYTLCFTVYETDNVKAKPDASPKQLWNSHSNLSLMRLTCSPPLPPHAASLSPPPLHSSPSFSSLYFLNCSFPPYSSGSIGTNAVEWLGGKVPSIYSIYQTLHTHTHLPQAPGPLLHVGSGCVDVVPYAVNLLLLGLMHRG